MKAMLTVLCGLPASQRWPVVISPSRLCDQLARVGRIVKVQEEKRAKGML